LHNYLTKILYWVVRQYRTTQYRSQYFETQM